MDNPKQDLALLMILAGPAGSGKSTLCDAMMERHPAIERVITCTTRPPRDGEVHGEHYYFLSHEEFDQKVADGAFYEYAQVHTNRYGTLKEEIQTRLNAGIDLVMNIDVQGVEAFQKAAETDELLRQRLVTVFVLPESEDVIRERLQGRGQDDEAEIERRLASARKEITRWREYDFCMITRSREEDASRMDAIWQAEKLRVSRI